MDKYKKMVIDAGLEMCKRNLTVGTWGNISCRDPKTGTIYITPSGMDYQTLTEDDIVSLDCSGKIIDGKRKPSIEYLMHLKVYQKRPEVNGIIHTHPVYSTAFAVTGTPLPPISEDFVQIVGESAICAEYALPGTSELAENVAEALGNRNAVLLISHGTLCVGPDLAFALKVCDVVEKTAHIYLISRSLGEPLLISDADIQAMQDFVRTKYGQ